MMQVYLDALTASAKGSAQYVLSRSLDLFRTYNRDVALSHLVSGWNIEAVCISGVMERNWMLRPMAIVDGESEDDQTKAVTNNVIYQRIAELLNLPIQQCATSIHTQEFFDSAGNLETIWMYLDIWKLNARKPETIWIAPKNPVSDPKSFKEGQEKAKQILDILIVQNIKQDKEYVTHLLQTNVTKFSHKI